MANVGGRRRSVAGDLKDTGQGLLTENMSMRIHLCRVPKNANLALQLQKELSPFS